MTPHHRPGRRGSARTRRALRDLHHQTWELELLISGTVAIVLALLPGRIDQLYFTATAQLAGEVDQVAFFAYYFTKLTLYTLIAAFAFHIAVRAFWVAMVGLDSVFPRGPSWSSLKLGPIAEGVYRRVLPSVRELIVAADGVASVTFATAFTLVAILAVSVPWVLVFGGAGFIAVRVLGLPVDFLVILVGGTVVGATLLQIPILIDRFRGRQMLADGRAGWVERALEWTVNLSGVRLFGPIQFTLASRVGRTWFSAGLGVFAAGVVTYFITVDIIGKSSIVARSVDGWDPVRAGEYEVNPRLYEVDFDPTRRRSMVPSIPEPVLDGEATFVRLFVPHLPESDPPALERVCPDVSASARGGVSLVPRPSRAPDQAGSARAGRLLECRASLWDVRLDGEPVATTPRFFTRTDAGLRGLAWFVDVRDLAPGDHLIEVRRSEAALDPDGRSEEGDEDLPRVYRIPFWR